MDLTKAAKEKWSYSPSSVTYLYDSLTNTKNCNPTSISRRSFEWSEKSFQSSPKSQVKPFRYRPISIRGISREEHCEAPISAHDDRFQLINHVAKKSEASQEENELYIQAFCSNDRLNIPCVPDFNGSCSTLDFTLDGDQWIDKRKIPATAVKRSGRRPMRDEFDFETTNHSRRTFTNDIYMAEEQHRNTQIRAIQNIPNVSEPKDKTIVTIEVYPGEFLRLRGADETWHAIKYDFYMPCMCICCNLTLFCIQDAIFVLCPICRILSPLEGVVIDGFDGGVGLGFTIEELSMWQKEIAFGREIDASANSTANYARGIGH
jgi:hypothetical protein